MNVSVEIKNQDIDDLIIIALEGGIGYWANEARLFDDNENPTHDKTDNPTKNLGSIIIVEVEGDNGGEVEHTLRFVSRLTEEGGGRRRDFSQISAGLAHMATAYPQHFANIISGDADAETADIFIQCCLFKKTKYS